MVFVDILALQLYILGFAGLLLVYVALTGYWAKRGGKNVLEAVAPAAIPIALLGIYTAVSGLYGQFFWPLPGPYNMLFYDLYPTLGLLLVAAAWTIRSKLKMHYVGVFSLLTGLMVIYYGATGYSLKLTSEPLMLLGLYTSLGLAGVLAYPTTLVFDKIVAKEKIKSPICSFAVVLFCIFLIIGSLIALAVASAALPAHLANPP